MFKRKYAQERRIYMDLLLNWTGHDVGVSLLSTLSRCRLRCCGHGGLSHAALFTPSARESGFHGQLSGQLVYTKVLPTTYCPPFCLFARAKAEHSCRATFVMAESRISPYSLPDLKNTTDDALCNYLRGLGFKQDNSKTDFKLVVGYLAVIIAAATFVADYKLGWEATKNWTAVAVVAYSILNGIFTYHLWFVESGLVFEGSKDGKQVSFA